MKKIKKCCVFLLTVSIIMPGSAGTVLAKDSSRAHNVTLGGQSFGVRFYNDGVIITELEEFYDGKAYVCPGKDSGLRVNDVIKTAGGNKINCNEDLQQALQGSGDKPVSFTIERDGQSLSKTVTPKKNSAGNYLLGAWVKDSCAGIGTVTYTDSEQYYFAALGHGICDNSTSALLPLGSAEVTGAKISSVTKSSSGKPGSLNGYFTDNTLGSLSKNTPIGVFGKLDDIKNQSSPSLPIADKSEVHPGKAELYTTLEGDNVGCYSVEINRIRNTDKGSSENFVIKVTDDTLLQKCGGIVQGMSGSPIVQDGKLAGAVTHVFVNDPKKGYGVLAQNMESKYNE